MDAEQIILGGVLAGIVKPSGIGLDRHDFTNEEYGDAFAVCLECERSDTVLDATLLHNRLVGNEIGWTSAKTYEQMASSATSAALVFDAVNRIKAASLKRFLIARNAQLGLDEDRSATAILDDWRRTVAEAESRFSTSENSFQFLREIAPKVQSVYDDLYAGISYAVPTYMPLTDHLLGDGYGKGDLHVIVGMTGAGKSSVALNHALNQAKAGHVVGIVSREMSDIENVMRIQAASAKIPRWQMRKDMFLTTHNDLKQNLREIAELPIAFDTRTSDIETLTLNTRQMVEKHDLSILYVDYLQLLSSRMGQDTRANEVQTISRGLKTLAMDTRIPVVALCQFNNGVANASLFDVMNYIRESGSIKQDASTIAYIQVEHTVERREIKNAKYTVLKNRNGAAFASITMSFNGAQFQFTEIEECAE